jgi:hypothetical protein
VRAITGNLDTELIMSVPFRRVSNADDRRSDVRAWGIPANMRSKPVGIMWGMCDPAFTPQMLDSLWLSYSHDRRGQAPGGRGHFLQEDAHEGIVARAAALPGATPDRTARDRSTSER